VVNVNYVSSPKFVQSRKDGSPNVRRLRIKVLEVFQQTAYGIFLMRQPVKQIAYKYCINFANTEFPYRI